MRETAVIRFLLTGCALVFAPCAFAQEYPSRPVRLIAPFPAGGGVDIVARQLAQKLAEKWRQQVVVDNRAGATGTIGADLAAKAAPDGYTLLLGNVATQAVNVSLYKSLPYDPVRDFVPITLIARLPEVLVVHPALPATTVTELIALANARPGKLTVGSAGHGSPPHLAAELLQFLAKVQFVHVPYKGSAPALADLIGGQINLYFGNILSVAPLVRNGRLRALGVTGAQRSHVLPDILTIAEAGVPRYQEYNWYGLLAPRGAPASIVGKVHAATVAALQGRELKSRLEQDGAEVIASSPQEFARFVRAEIDKYAAVIRERNLRAD
jgi:tripartite-type tricarboxylate transporter receptor subunit TctC